MEVELATSAQKRNIVLTFGAATATVVAVIAVLAGPAMLDCAASPDGMATCLRDRVSDFGLLPPRDVDRPAEPAPEPRPAPPEVTAGVPELTLLRAEPDGSIVVAGTAGAGARVAVYVNGELLGTVTAEQSGDWALVPDAPLPSGGSEITVREAEGDGVGTRSFVVVIDPDKIDEPKVVATTPAEAGDVLAELTQSEPTAQTGREPAAEPAQPAEPEPSAAPAARPAPPMQAEDVFTIVAQVPPQVRFATRLVATAGASAAASGNLAIAEPAIEVARIDPFAVSPEIPRPLRFGTRLAATAGASAVASGNLAIAEPAIEVARIDPFSVSPEIPRPLRFGTRLIATAGASAVASGNLTMPEPAIEVARIDPFAVSPEIPPPLRIDAHVSGATGRLAFVHAEVELPPPVVVVAGIDPFAIAPEVPPPTPADDTVAVGEPQIAPVEPPTIDAIELDGRMNFFAGAGEEGATIRLFIGDRLIGESKVEGERWLVEAADALTMPDQRIRVEMVLEGSRAVAATAAANVMVDAPAPSLSVEQAPRRMIRAELPRLTIRPKSEPGMADAPAVLVGMASVEGSAGLAIETGRLDLAVRLPQEHMAPSAAVAAPTSPCIEILETKPLHPAVAGEDDEAGSVIMLPGATGAGIPTLRATPLREMRFGSGKVIIRRGDTLWDIADRVYGDGYKYRTIYRANRDKIRRPGRIYPGQVFDIPLVYDDY